MTNSKIPEIQVKTILGRVFTCTRLTHSSPALSAQMSANKDWARKRTVEWVFGAMGLEAPTVATHAGQPFTVDGWVFRVDTTSFGEACISLSGSGSPLWSGSDRGELFDPKIRHVPGWQNKVLAIAVMVNRCTHFEEKTNMAGFDPSFVPLNDRPVDVWEALDFARASLSPWRHHLPQHFLGLDLGDEGLSLLFKKKLAADALFAPEADPVFRCQSESWHDNTEVLRGSLHSSFRWPEKLFGDAIFVEVSVDDALQASLLRAEIKTYSHAEKAYVNARTVPAEVLGLMLGSRK